MAKWKKNNIDRHIFQTLGPSNGGSRPVEDPPFEGQKHKLKVLKAKVFKSRNPITIAVTNTSDPEGNRVFA